MRTKLKTMLRGIVPAKRLTMVSVNGQAIFIYLPTDWLGKVRVNEKTRQVIIDTLKIRPGDCVMWG